MERLNKTNCHGQCRADAHTTSVVLQAFRSPVASAVGVVTGEGTPAPRMLEHLQQIPLIPVSILNLGKSDKITLQQFRISSPYSFAREKIPFPGGNLRPRFYSQSSVILPFSRETSVRACASVDLVSSFFQVRHMRVATPDDTTEEIRRSTGEEEPDGAHRHRVC
jgi:hypothetical protein